MSHPRITCHCRPEHAFAGTVVRRALERSFGQAQVVPILLSPDETPGEVAVYIAPETASRPNMEALLRHGCKVLAFGRPDDALASLLGIGHEATASNSVPLDAAEMCFAEYVHTSPGFVRYGDHPLALVSPLRQRHCRRYDYAEWNNLGYGAITSDGGPFAAVTGYQASTAEALAHLRRQDQDASEGTYLALRDEARGSLLWCARLTGPVDSLEWLVVERFICDWRPDLYCLPCLEQTPAGCSCLVTMRLDCDEAIASAQALFQWYRDHGLPLSLAVRTDLNMNRADRALLEDVRQAGGTLLSHSHTHPKNWGDDLAQARDEAERSRQWFVRQWPGTPPTTLAVSPFHTNPPYAMQALAATGFTGVVGGIIHNNPEYCLGRAGVIPFADGIVSISQQSMVHGDSYRNQGKTVDVHVQACQEQVAARGIFGYLDHPFSPRYQYGWDSEDQRLEAHAKLVGSFMSMPGLWFWSQQRCFDFVMALAAATPRLEAGQVVGNSSGSGLEYRLRGEVCPLGG